VILDRNKVKTIDIIDYDNYNDSYCINKKTNCDNKVDKKPWFEMLLIKHIK